MAAVIRNHTRFVFNRITQPTRYSLRQIATSKKNKDTAVVSENVCKPSIDFRKPETQNWVSYGFHVDDEKADRDAMHSIFFVSVSLCVVGFGFFITYYPDFGEKNWVQREAFLEVRRREALGLPYIDREFIPIEKLKIPADEDLGDNEIII